MDALDLLISDHNRVRGLFARFESARDKDDEKLVQDIADKIVEELTVHTAIEEEIFYPTVRDTSDEIAQIVAESLQEHHVVKVLMGELQDVPPVSEAWLAKMTVIIENVEHHAEEEEQEFFPKVRSATDAEARELLGARLDARKGELGAPTLSDRSELTNEQVQELARAQEIPGRSKMSAEQLRATIDPEG